MNRVFMDIDGREYDVTEMLRWPPHLQRILFGFSIGELPFYPTPAPPPPSLPARPRTALGWGLLGALVALSLVACTPNVQPPQVPPGYKENPY